MVGRGDGQAYRRRNRPADGTVECKGGLLVLRAPAPVLWVWAVMIAGLSSANRYGTADAEFADGRWPGNWWPHGEVQIFADYRRRVGVAEVARREVLAAGPPPGATPDDVRQAVWRQGEAVSRRRSRPR